FNTASGGAFFNVSQGTDANDKKLAFVKFGGTAVTPDSPLYIFLWSNEPLHVLQVKPANIRPPS
ncbi:MAG: hypothetical protein WAL69_12250, partial [Candidatus Acidiferrales bacterium]